MFYKSSFNGDIGDWDVRNVLSMNMMFAYSDFEGDLTGWEVNKKCNVWCMLFKSEVADEYMPDVLKYSNEKHAQVFGELSEQKCYIKEDFLDVHQIDITQTEDSAG